MKVRLSLTTLTCDELADLGDNVHTAMVANAATFTAPNPTMPALATGTTALRNAIAARLAADSAAKTALETLQAAAVAERALLSQEGSYVENRAAGDGAIIALAGKVFLRVCARGADAQNGPWSDLAEEMVR